MVSFNRVVLAGNLTRDPELRFTNDGIPVCSFGLAVNRVRSRNEEVDFFDISAWRELGETIANYKKKGDPILLEGRLQYRTWEAQDGSKRSKVDVVADNVQFLGRPGDSDDGASSGGSVPSVPPAPGATSPALDPSSPGATARRSRTAAAPSCTRGGSGPPPGRRAGQGPAPGDRRSAT